MSEVIDELSFVHFELGSKDFYDFDFIPNGIGDHSISKYPLFNDSLENLKYLLIYFFLNLLVFIFYKSGIKLINSNLIFCSFLPQFLNFIKLSAN